ncbi:DEP domain-containing protein 1A isoform X2 [Spea bombifrons]|uniref:DEP domain-containing protein 1A isoform X2 n=1 Tax=Spea bombifrons TaxID=233779 RepID=UPI002349364C|nr:DEP domain-containing protein 1A isoform X2 [Spea bombifrons]
MESRIITPGPYRATKLWNEVTKYFRAGMPLKRHRLHFKTYGNCFTASEAVDWLHHLLKNNSNFGAEVTRQQSVQLLRKFLKNHVIEDIKGRWGAEDLDDNNNLYRFPSSSPVKAVPSRQPLWKRSSLENVFKERDNIFKLASFSRKVPRKRASSDNKDEQENEACEMDEDLESGTDGPKELTTKDIEEIWGRITLTHLQKILALPSLDEVLNPAQINPGHIMYNMTHTSKHGVVVLEDKTDDLPHWVLSAMKCLANWPRNNDLSQPTYPGFERDVFRTVADYFLSLAEPLLTYEYYELFVNILGLLQPHLERVAIEALQLCCLLLPPHNRRKLQLLMRMISRMSQNVDMPRLHDAMGTRSLMIQTFSRCVLCCSEEVDLDELLATRLVSFLLDHHQDVLQVPCYLQTAVQDHIQYLQRAHAKAPDAAPSYYFCKQISRQEFEAQRFATSQAAIEELLESIVRDRRLSAKDKKKKLKQFQKEYPEIYHSRFPTTESEAKLFGDKPTIKQPMLVLKKPKFRGLRH